MVNLPKISLTAPVPGFKFSSFMITQTICKLFVCLFLMWTFAHLFLILIIPDQTLWHFFMCFGKDRATGLNALMSLTKLFASTNTSVVSPFFMGDKQPLLLLLDYKTDERKGSVSLGRMDCSLVHSWCDQSVCTSPPTSTMALEQDRSVPIEVYSSGKSINN